MLEGSFAAFLPPKDLAPRCFKESTSTSAKTTFPGKLGDTLGVAATTSAEKLSGKRTPTTVMLFETFTLITRCSSA